MRKYLVAVALWAFSTCAFAAYRDDVEREVYGAFERSEWTKQERIAFGLSLAAHLLDLGSSLASDERCVEKNPLLGTNPSNGALIGTKAIAIGFEYWLYNSPRISSKNTHWFGYTSAIIHGAVGLSNLQNDCY